MEGDSARISETFSKQSSINFCPPNPGSTVITRTMSLTIRRYIETNRRGIKSAIAETGVFGLMVTEHSIPASRTRLIMSLGSSRCNYSTKQLLAASIWKLNMFAPASLRGVMYRSGFSTIRWQSRNELQITPQPYNDSICLRSDFTTGAPIVRLGTKWPS